MRNPYYFTDRALHVGFDKKLDSHNINNANSKLTSKPNFPGLRIETRYLNEILKEMTSIFARLKTQCRFKTLTVSSTRFEKQDENGHMLDEIEFFTNLNFNQSSIESDIGTIDTISQLEHQIQK